MRITFDGLGTDEGTEEWIVLIDDVPSHDLIRGYHTRYHANGVGGLVCDRERPRWWQTDLSGVEIPDGASLREAKRIIRQAIIRRNSNT